jgi:hypothetical protein
VWLHTLFALNMYTKELLGTGRHVTSLHLSAHQGWTRVALSVASRLRGGGPFQNQRPEVKSAQVMSSIKVERVRFRSNAWCMKRVLPTS